MVSSEGEIALMIICPNCNHQNPAVAVQCEACYTPLPEMAACPTCGAPVQTDASFCGQCGADLGHPAPVGTELEIPELLPPDPLVVPDPIAAGPIPGAASPVPVAAPPDNGPDGSAPPLPAPVEAELSEASPPAPVMPLTRLQRQVARLLHVQTDTPIELPGNLSVVRIGKPNDRIPPDIDVSGFADADIVSRVHAQIRIEGDSHYIEDVGSSNGTYINNLPLPYGNRHRLRPGDRIALGKGDKVSFIFQMT
jgi:ribosomal protein L40E